MARGEEADRVEEEPPRLKLTELPPALLPWMLGGGVRSKKARSAVLETVVAEADRVLRRYAPSSCRRRYLDDEEGDMERCCCCCCKA